MDITKLSLRTLFRKVRSKELKCVEIIEAFTKNIENKKNLNAIIYFNKDEVYAEAEKCDDDVSNGRLKGRLHGIPLIVKDNIHIKHIPNTAGCIAFKDFIPKKDSVVIEKLRNDGAIFIAKANMHELAFGVTSNNATYGPARNAHNYNVSAGGSSGGTGCAIASYMSPAGLGSDTGGSVRIPSSVNAIYGFRPTIKRYSQSGVTPLSLSRDTIGPMGNCIDDVVYLDEIITDEKQNIHNLDLKGFRIGIPNALCENLDHEIEETFNKAKISLKKHGAILVDVDIKEVTRLASIIGNKIIFYEPYREIANYLQENEIKLTPNELYNQIASPDVKDIWKTKLSPSSQEAIKHDEYEEAIVRDLPELIKSYRKLLTDNNVCALVFPTLPCLPVHFDQITEPSTLFSFIRNTNLASVVGAPGLSIPMGTSKLGLPIGLEIDGHRYEDRFVLALGCALDKILQN